MSVGEIRYDGTMPHAELVPRFAAETGTGSTAVLAYTDPTPGAYITAVYGIFRSTVLEGTAGRAAAVVNQYYQHVAGLSGNITFWHNPSQLALGLADEVVAGEWHHLQEDRRTVTGGIVQATPYDTEEQPGFLLNLAFIGTDGVAFVQHRPHALHEPDDLNPWIRWDNAKKRLGGSAYLSVGLSPELEMHPHDRLVMMSGVMNVQAVGALALFSEQVRQPLPADQLAQKLFRLSTSPGSKVVLVLDCLERP